MGFALQQMNLPSHTSDEAAELADNILRELPADEYPHLAEMIIEHALKPGYDYGEEFEFGLNPILDGLERLRGGLILVRTSVDDGRYAAGDL